LAADLLHGRRPLSIGLIDETLPVRKRPVYEWILLPQNLLPVARYQWHQSAFS
jgi:hypothetical protein